MKKVLFYTSIPRGFCDVGIAYLYEIAKVQPVVLLSEELDPKTKKILHSKTLFPNLQKILPVHQFTKSNPNIFKKNGYLYTLAKNIIETEKPDVIVTSDDIYPFELYLLRLAKRKGIYTIAIQPSLHPETGEVRLYNILLDAHLRTPPWLPLFLRIGFVKVKRLAGHFLYYWILPFLMGEPPFKGQSSYILWKGSPGLRDSDYYIVFSKRDYDLCVQEGVSKNKLRIIAHSLCRIHTRKFLERNLLKENNAYRTTRKTLTFFYPSERIGIKKADYSLIPAQEMQEKRERLLKIINEILSSWQIIVKPHPQTENFMNLKTRLESLSPNIRVADPADRASHYIAVSNVIIGIPPVSTTLYTSSLQCPKKAILSINLYNELLGDLYKNFSGIDYIEEENDLIKTLKCLQENTYHKPSSALALSSQTFISVFQKLSHTNVSNISA